jgi:regulator of replication initiation timing
MALEDVLVKLPEEDQVVVKDALEAEKTKGIESYRAAKAEANRLLNKWKPVEESLIDNGFDLDQPLNDQFAKLKVSTGSSNEEIENLKRDQRKAAKEIADLRLENDKAKQIKKSFDNTKIASALDKAFGDKLIVKDHVIENLILKGTVKIKDDESIVFVNGDLEDELTIGVENFIKSNPSIVKPNQSQGSGEKGNQTEKKTKQMSRSDFEKMLPSDKLEFFKAGGSLI